jgi:DNA primase
MTFDDVAKILEVRGRVSYTGSKSLTACCPAHNDTRPSFSVSEKNGKLLLYCFAGAATRTSSTHSDSR